MQLPADNYADHVQAGLLRQRVDTAKSVAMQLPGADLSHDQQLELLDQLKQQLVEQEYASLCPLFP